MIFLDSWVWIEFFSKDKRWKKAQEVIRKLEEDNEIGLISTLVLTEVRYRIKRKFDQDKADRVIHAIESFKNLRILPVTTEVAKLGADLRDKYYQKKSKEISYADAIYLATAVLAGCKILYSGDPDFKDIEEIDTKVI